MKYTECVKTANDLFLSVYKTVYNKASYALSDAQLTILNQVEALYNQALISQPHSSHAKDQIGLINEMRKISASWNTKK